MEQSTIFEESFGTELLTRRRSLLPLFLKVYIWIGIVLSCLLFFLLLITLGTFAFLIGSNNYNTLGYLSLAGTTGLTFIFSGVIFSNVATLWFELKWAIRFNWVMGAIWALLLLLGFFRRTAGMGEFLLVCLTIPYWVMIYKIQYQWENEAVSIREMNKKRS
ncbi:hypothetical protein [Chitinophaga sancti]|uniref:hypothetical protein n=1 Tax=Chitinophaga sancti TaxID=1004 RepID=UPI003F7A5EFD